MGTGLSDYIRLRQAITGHQYFQAIELSKGLPPESFLLAVFQRVNRGKIESTFWDALFTEEAQHLFKTELIHSILREFWSSDWTKEQVESFSIHYPKVFCQSIRLSRVFLEDNFFYRIRSAAPQTPYIDSHFSKMQEFKSKLELLNQQVVNQKEKLISIELEELLTELTIWWENEWTRQMARQQRLSTVYHNVLKAYFEIKPDANATSESLFKKFGLVLKRYKQTPKLRIQSVLDSFMALQHFETTELENYCYEIKHDFNKKGEYIIDKRAIIKYQNDGKKLGVFQTYWQFFANQMLDRLIEQGEIKLNPRNDIDWYSYMSQIQSNLMLDYVGEGSEIERLTSGFFANIETHSLSRYRRVMWDLIAEKDDVITALAKVSFIDNGRGFPVQLNGYAAFKKMTYTTFKGTVSLELIDKLLKRVTSESKDLNMLERPLIKLASGQILNLMNLTSESNFFLRGYFNMVDAIDDTSERQSDRSFEQMICKAFQVANFEAYCGVEYLQKTQDGSAGDLDVIVKEGAYTLLLEVKRIKLRYDSAGIWNERELKTNWASLQLHKASLALKAKTPEVLAVLSEEVKEIRSLIINPWFEYDHEFVGNYLKVSWFEIQYALTEMKKDWQKAPNKLKALTDLIIEDKVWPDIFKKAKAYEDILKSTSKNQ